MDSAQVILLGLLNSDYTEDKFIREEVYDLLLNIAYKRQQLELQLHWGARKVECCRELGRETEALRTEADLAFALAQLGEEQKGLTKLNSIIAKLDGQRNIDKMDACIIALKRKIFTLKQMGGGGLSLIRGWKNRLELVIKTDHQGVVELLFDQAVGDVVGDSHRND